MKELIMEQYSNNIMWLQSLSKVVGTHLILVCNWIITVCYMYTIPLPSPRSMLFKAKHIKYDEKWHTTLNGGGEGGSTFVEILGFCGICAKIFETDCI